MKWFKEFKFEPLDTLSLTGNHFIDSRPPEPPFKYDSVLDSKMWTIWMDDPMEKPLFETRKMISEITGLNLEYEEGFLVIWRFDENFPRCPIHVDEGRGNGGKHNGSVVSVLSGEFKIHLHDEKDEIIESVDVTSNTLIALNNTRFPHSVEGCGDLLVFGVDLKTEPEIFWND